MTPEYAGVQQLIAAALADVSAEYVGPAGQYRLQDGEAVNYIDDAFHDAGVLEFETATDDVARTVFRLAERLGALIMFEPEGRSAWRTPDNVGAPVSALTREQLGVVDSPATLRELLSAHASSSDDDGEPAADPKPPWARSLSDMLFGKSV